MKMKSVGKAAELLRKAAAAALRGSRVGVLRARLLFLATFPRRRAAVVAGMSRQLRTLLSRVPAGHAHADVEDDKDERAATTPGSVAELASLLLFREVDEDGDGSGYQEDWTLALNSLFDDEESLGRGEDEHRAGDGDVEEDGPSVIEIIRRRREREGREFRIEDEIDHAADMFIKRVRCRRMNI